MSEEVHYKMLWHDEFVLADIATGKMYNDPGYNKTICGQIRKLWALINVDLDGKIPKNKLDEINKRIKIAYEMGKKMDKRLREQLMEICNLKEQPMPEGNTHE
jgi:hypothetical protein